MEFWRSLTFFRVLTVCAGCVGLNVVVPGALSQPFPNAHAHNDYKHERPLLDALHAGFTSVEADIYLIKGRLLVSHNRPFFEARTLSELYLKPLDSILHYNNGLIYPGYAETFFLMIDLKSDGDAIYPVLKDEISKYPSIGAGLASPSRFVIFLSGNRPIQAVLNDPDHQISLDGRPEDLDHGISSARMPVISDTYRKWSDWSGHGQPGAGELDKVMALANRVHAEGKKLRLWAIPDGPDAWRALLHAGVDLINTDDLNGLADFLKKPD